MANDSQLSVKLPASERKAFVQICATNDTTASREIRKFIRDYIAKNNQGKLFA
jgi:hypothetical protein